MSMPKLFQINSALNCGSTGRIAEQIGLLAQRNGYEVYIAHGSRYKNPSQLHSMQVVTPFEEWCHGVYSLIFDRHGLASTRQTESLVERIAEIHPDIIHLHNIHGYYLNYEVLFRYLSESEIPVVWTLHDCWSFTGHCTHFDYEGCEKWKMGCDSCPLKSMYPRSLFIDNSRDNYSRKKSAFTSVKNMTLVPVSDWLGGLVKQSFLRDYPIHVLHNGTDVKTFSPKSSLDLNRKFGTEGKKYVLGVAAPWSQRKGLDDVIELSRQLDGSEYQILLVGLSQKQIRALPSEIIGIERTQNVQELSGYYAGADVFINPTLEDNFPTTNIEALACGTPVVTYNTGGSPEAISSETGLVVEKGNVAGLAEAVELICQKGKRDYSESCRKRAEELYDKDKCFGEYLCLYERLLSDSNVIF